MAKNEFLFFNSRDELLRLDISKIVFFEGEGNYTSIVSANNLKGVVCINGSLKFEITAKRLYAASQRVL